MVFCKPVSTRKGRLKRSRMLSSDAGNLRGALEACGEYVTRANGETGWFAVFPDKLEKLLKRAVHDGREGPNLIVYRTNSNIPRDHYVIPYSDIRHRLVKDSLTTSSVDGVQRWNLTLKKDKLHVSHMAGNVDVSKYRGAPLLVEEVEILADLIEPTADSAEFERRVRLLKGMPLAHPLGRPVPSKLTVDRTTYQRCPDVKAWVLNQAEGRCELCWHPAPFKDEYGEPFLELHHVQQLADGGPDTAENAVALCPNCHRLLHHGMDRSVHREKLYEQVTRLVRGCGRL